MHARGETLSAMAISWKPVAASAGVTLAIVGIGIAYLLGQQSAPAAPVSEAPPYAAPYPVLPSESTHTIAGQPQQTAAPAAQCEIEGAMHARMRDRGTALDYATVAMNTLQAANGRGSVQIVGWSAAASLDGPPCTADFVYTLNGMRRDAHFAYWPGAVARIASANDEADAMGDMGDIMMLGGRVPIVQTASTDQLAYATAMRVVGRRYNEDVFMDPQLPATITMRRPHCVPGNVDLQAANQISIVRRLRIRRMRCVGDQNWTQDIPAHGPVADPYIATD